MKGGHLVTTSFASSPFVGKWMVLSFVTATSLLGCSEGGSGGQGRIVPAADYSGCQIKPDVGQKATMINASRDEIVVSPFFNKKYDRADLLAVMESSVISTAEYAQAISLNLYKIPQSTSKQATQKRCTTHYSLPTPRQELKDIWDEYSGGDNGGGQLMGLYFEDCGQSCSERKVQNPTILVNEESDRWTLVHEMLHHNFNLNRKIDTDLPTKTQVSNTLQRLLAQLDANKQAYLEDRTEGLLSLISKQTHQLSYLVYELMTRSVFEEMAIEGMLVDEWDAGRLKFVSHQSALSAVWYMSYSRDKGMDVLNEVRSRFLDFVNKEAQMNGWLTVAAQAKETDLYLSDISYKTAEMIETASAKTEAIRHPTDTQGMKQINAAYMALTNFSHIDHNAEGEELLKILKNSLNNSSF